MGWVSQSPETWLGLVLLIAIVTAITRAAFSQKSDARMDFFFRLIENIPTDEAPAMHTHETNPVRSKQET